MASKPHITASCMVSMIAKPKVHGILGFCKDSTERPPSQGGMDYMPGMCSWMIPACMSSRPFMQHIFPCLNIGWGNA
eukprot:scaffold30290_cov20-Prasinocladus_malaysianus.AAC.1